MLISYIYLSYEERQRFIAQGQEELKIVRQELRDKQEKLAYKLWETGYSTDANKNWEYARYILVSERYAKIWWLKIVLKSELWSQLPPEIVELIWEKCKFN